MLRRTLALVPFALCLFLACGSDEDGSTTSTAPGCTPGQTVACACPGTTVTGAQTCLPGGSFGACEGCPSGQGGAGAGGGASGGGGGGSDAGTGGGGTGGGGATAGTGGGGTGGGGAAAGTGGGGGAGQGGTAGTGGGGAGAGGSSAGTGGGGATAGTGGGGTGGGGTGGGWPATCAEAEAQGTTVGCEFWAVDLENEPNSVGDNPSAEPWGLVLTNSGDLPAEVTIEVNDGAPGQPLQVKQHKKVTVAAGAYLAELMPSREVDGGDGPGDPKAPGTFLSSAAFRIRSTRPVTAHQFNTASNSFSNDASLLLPTHALGASYRVLAWKPANPINLGVSIPGIPDRAYLTVVGVAEGTTVKVTPTWKIRQGPTLPFTPAGSSVEVKLGPFDVLNLETDDATQAEAASGGELSGSEVTSNQPVAVFFGNERGIATGGPDAPKPPGWDGDTCCTDHLEEQIPPTSALGTRFAIARSPVRSTGGYVEPDVLRVVASGSAVTVKTSLPGAFQQFSLQPGEWKDLWTTTDMTLEASAPVLVGQVLVSQGLIAGTKKGDPSLTLLPSVEQFLPEHAIPMPASWDEQYLAIVHPVGASVKIDGKAPSGCESKVIGVLDGKSYAALRCPIVPDLRRVTSDQPISVVAYGYGATGSYALLGAARMKK